MSSNYEPAPQVRQMAKVAPPLTRAQLPGNDMMSGAAFESASSSNAPLQYSANNTGRRMPEFNRTAFGQGSADMLGPVPPPAGAKPPIGNNIAIATAPEAPVTHTQRLESVALNMPHGVVIPTAPAKNAKSQIPLPPAQSAEQMPPATTPPVAAVSACAVSCKQYAARRNLAAARGNPAMAESIQPAPIATIDKMQSLVRMMLRNYKLPQTVCCRESFFRQCRHYPDAG